MKQRFMLLGLFVFLLSSLLAGCCGGGKETMVVSQPASTVTKGQELQDLKEAQEQGAISDEEFEKAKEQVLEKE